MSSSTMEPTDTVPLLIGRNTAARLAGVSVSTWDRLVSAGKTPLAVRLTSGCVRWRRADVERWIAQGCPAQNAVREMGRDNRG